MSSQALKQAVTGQAPAQPEPRDEYQRLKQQLERSKAEFKPLMGGSDANVDTFIRIVLNAVMANPDLLAADRRSLMVGCMKAAQDGLVPDGREAVLNIYNTNIARRGEPEKWVPVVQYLPMVGGIIKSLYASGEILTLDAAVVCANDKFRFVRGDEPKLEHEPTLDDDCGNIIAAYCVVKLKNGELKREVMPWRDIVQVRAASKSADGANSPWVKWLDQMCIKSVIKRISKQLPRNERFDQVERSDNEALGFAGTPESIADITARNVATAAAPASAASGALEYSPTGYGFDIPTGRGEDREPLPVGGEPEQVGQARPQASNEDQRQPLAFNEAAFVARIDACTSMDGLDLLQDDARGIADAAVRVRLSDRCDDRRRALDARPSSSPAPAQASATNTRAPRRGSGQIPEVN